ncbi:hypothetical protein [Amycolatopsis pretoriensis]|uniref:hypothetical protein n=1 Tax=Amycolatopsis pretoriensis TaxID=218821 RepID=UPI000A55DBA8|nr:hypothetical protein [Amycolatopsis pretoriensis]
MAEWHRVDPADVPADGRVRSVTVDAALLRDARRPVFVVRRGDFVGGPGAAYGFAAVAVLIGGLLAVSRRRIPRGVPGSLVGGDTAAGEGGFRWAPRRSKRPGSPSATATSRPSTS